MSQMIRSNGRLGWRRWAKSRRRHMNEHHRKLYQGAVMRRKQPERTPLRKKLLSAKQLIGMTQGARKRAYHKAVRDLEQADVWNGDVVSRERFFIGQRLRRCPGCADCDSNRKLYRLKTTNRVFQTAAGTSCPSLMEIGIISEERCGRLGLIKARKGRDGGR